MMSQFRLICAAGNFYLCRLDDTATERNWLVMRRLDF